jgi:hypothetical protein
MKMIFGFEGSAAGAGPEAKPSAKRRSGRSESFTHSKPRDRAKLGQRNRRIFAIDPRAGR